MSDTGTSATKNLVPLSPAVFAILLALAGGEKHGYAIMKEAAEPAGGAIKLGPGTLYGTIDRMIRDQLVEETGFTDDARRRYYRITDFGHRIFAAELFRIENMVRAARSKAPPKEPAHEDRHATQPVPPRALSQLSSSLPLASSPYLQRPVAADSTRCPH